MSRNRRFNERSMRISVQRYTQKIEEREPRNLLLEKPQKRSQVPEKPETQTTVKDSSKCSDELSMSAFWAAAAVTKAQLSKEPVPKVRKEPGLGDVLSYQKTPWRQRDRASYNIELVRRCLPSGSHEKVAKVIRSEVPTDFNLIALDGQNVPCHRVVIENMCEMLNISPEWAPLTSIHVEADLDSVVRLKDFMYSGFIRITECNIETLLALADFLVFNCLLKLCVKYLYESCSNKQVLLPIHKKFGHIPGLTPAFLECFNDLPKELEAGRELSLLEALNSQQMNLLLASEDLWVENEDDALHFLLEWARLTKRSKDEIAQGLKLIRKPYILARLARHWTKILASKHNIFNFYPEDFQRSSPCKPRKHYERHAHFLWREHLFGTNGPTQVHITCVTWSADNENVKEVSLFKCLEGDYGREDMRSAEYASLKDELVRVAQNKSGTTINISRLNTRRRAFERKHVINLTPIAITASADFAITKNLENLSITYYDGLMQGSKFVSINTKTWKKTESKNLLVETLPCNFRELKVYDDFTVGISCRMVFILEKDSTQVTEVKMPKVIGYLVDFEQIDGYLYVLEDLSRTRMVEEGRQDRVHCIDLKEKKHLSFGLVENAEKQSTESKLSKYGRERTTKFLKIQSELYIIKQEDNDEPLSIFHYDIVQQTGSPTVTLKAPTPPCSSDPDDAHTRAFKGTVPLCVFSCPHTRLKDSI